MPLYSFDPIEAEIFARRRRTGPLLEDLWARRIRRRTVTRRRAGSESRPGHHTVGRRAA